MEFFQNDLQNAAQTLFAQIAGCAASEVDRVYAVAGEESGGFCDMGAKSISIAVHLRLAARERVKIAVDTLALAEGDVNVNP